MRRKYRNEIFHLIGKVGFNQEDFTLTDDIVSDLPATIIQYKDTPFKFIVRNTKESYESFDYMFVPFGPGNVMTNIQPEQGFVDFSTVYDEIEKWLVHDVKGYIEDEVEPDLWAEFNRRDKSFDINKIDFNNKSNFSLDERKHVTLAINELKLLIQKNMKTSEEEQKLVNDRLDYLVESSERLNKFDWKGLAISTLISISLSLSLDTEKGRLLFELFRKVFATIPLLTN